MRFIKGVIFSTFLAPLLGGPGLYAAEFEVLDRFSVDGYAVLRGSADIPGGSFTVGGSTFVVKGGKVGIGTAGPGANLHISSTSASAAQDMLKITTGTVNADVFVIKGNGDVTVAGGIKIGNVTSCTSDTAGTLRWYDGHMSVCNGTAWRQLDNQPPPTITSIAPAAGIVTGGTAITIIGTGFNQGLELTLGGAPATSIALTGAIQITAVTPAGTAGPRDVKITNSDGQYITGTFTYNPLPAASGPVSPASGTQGTVITIAGTDFVSGLTVTIDGVSATVNSVTATQVVAVAPINAATGAKNIIITNPDTGSVTLTSGFTYLAPAVTGVNPSYGSGLGGTVITITGTSFVSATGLAVTIGGAAAASFTWNSATQITATTPASTTSGAKAVTVTNRDSGSGTKSDGFTYMAYATGGTVTTVGSYRVHTFTAGSALTFATGGNVEYLVVAGGGAGGYDVAGGGGGGGLIYNSAYPATTASPYTVTIGAGGTAGGQTGANGSNSVFASATAIGGGGGGDPGSSGGSGGGGSYGQTGGAGTGGQGNAGGAGYQVGVYYNSGGGGGAGGGGTTATAAAGGAGGLGAVYSISGAAVYYAAGGGGGWLDNTGATGSLSNLGQGGNGAGGNGGVSKGATVIAAATSPSTPGSGGGGGGWASGLNANGTNGAGGIVIVRYPVAAGLTIPTVTGISPVSGSGGGGTPVTITGTGFASDVAVTIGNAAATSVVRVSDTQITAITAASSNGGANDVTVTNNPDKSYGLKTGGFFYNPYAAGGTLAGSYYVRTFTTVGTSQLTFTTGGNIEVLVVAGGGGGGSSDQNCAFGAGGAGGLIYRNSFAVAAGPVTVTVGSGGSGGAYLPASPDRSGSNGQNSIFDTLTAIGGGGGNGGLADQRPGKNGGSGGGAEHGTAVANYTGGAALQPTSASGGYGNAGGNAYPSSTGSPAWGGGGGGGAGGAGTTGTATVGGTGGAGLLYAISGTSLSYAGGGGGGVCSVGQTFGVGKDGGGNGGAGGSGSNAAANTGGGGGGGGYTSASGGNGGSGIVIVRYPI